MPTNDNDLSSLGGDDTYILSSSNIKCRIVDTEGTNTIQLPEWSKIKSVI